MNNFTIGDTVKVQNGFLHAGIVGEIVDVHFETGGWLLDVPDVGKIEVDPNGLEAVTETPALEATKTHLANTHFRLTEMKTRLVSRQRKLIQKIKANPELVALQESIDLLEGAVNDLESEYNLAVKQTRDSAIAEHLAGQPKTRFDGLIQVRVLSNSVLHWDAKKAIVFAENLDDPETKAVLIKTSADKTGFKKLAKDKGFEFPADVAVFGDSYTAAISESDLLQHVTIDAIAEQESVADTNPDSEDAPKPKLYTVNGEELDTPF